MDAKGKSGSENVRVEHCMKCGGTTVRNNVYFHKGEPVRVYVQCAGCGEFVARYTLRAYTSDERYESLLRRLRFSKLNSGKRTLRIVEGFSEDVAAEFERVLELVRTSEDGRRMEQIIEEDYPESME